MSKNSVLKYTKTDKRILIEKLELLYNYTNFNHAFFLRHSVGERKTLVANRDREFRTKLKSIEILLFDLGSKLFEHDKQRPSIRKTFTVEASNYGLFQN